MRRPAGEFVQAARATLATLRDPRTDPERFQVLLTHLNVRQVDGTLTTGLIHESDLRNLWDGQAAFDTLLPGARDLRLLRTTTRVLDAGSDERLVSLGDDLCWPRWPCRGNSTWSGGRSGGSGGSEGSCHRCCRRLRGTALLAMERASGR